jgi:mannose-1-phosphate guanylyltransferase
VLRADRAWQALNQHVPAITQALSDLEGHSPASEAWREAFARCFGACPSVSIDYGVMEKESAIEVVRLDAGWSDVGTWQSLAGMRAEGQENFARGEVVSIDNRDCVLVSQGPLVAAVGLQGIAVIATADATLVLPADRSQDVREVIEELKRRGRTDLL